MSIPDHCVDNVNGVWTSFLWVQISTEVAGCDAQLCHNEDLVPAANASIQKRPATVASHDPTRRASATFIIHDCSLPR